ncbi:DUF4224 domain-containing protein [Alloalcanivorax xenomutans]|uniref:DUF4224 domain-containing protein n=1 Tax=Alloalcanivorax xenomutans TaxID=1094342 RepID=UPI003BAA0D8C
MNEPITLTREELEDITGLKQAAAQERWFRLHYGIQAERRADGSLSVPRRLYYQKAGIQQPKAEPQLRFSNAS